jgi:hypothetical protein
MSHQWIIWSSNLVLLIVWLAIWFFACLVIGRLREWHHIYIGLGIGAVPWFLWLGWWGFLLNALGQWIAADDALLHEGQAEDWEKGDRPLTGADDGASFWHRLAAHLHFI